MAETITIARPYAEAVFRIATEAGTQSAWSLRLQRLALIAKDAEILALVGDPALSAEKIADLFISLAQEKDDQLANFIQSLAENHRLRVLPEISMLFEKALSEAQGIKEAVVYSAFAIDEAQLKKILKSLEPRFECKLTGRVVIDADLIGGIRIAVGDQVLDASVRGKLDKMAVELNN